MLLETDRLLIRPFRLDDLDAYAKIVADPHVMRLLTGKPQTFDEAKQYIEECMASEDENGFSRYAVRLKVADELIGFCGYKIIDGEIDFGWRYAKRHWNRGYGTEAALAVMKYGFEVLRPPQLVAVALPENTASIRIMQKLGMERNDFGSWTRIQTIRYTLRNHL
jgi:RimJ/RimL family protein N-acetyltransferase